MAQQVQMVVWDVQHGNCTWIRTPNNKDVIIDLGLGDYSGKNERFSPLQAIRERYGVASLEYVVITHPHLDHIDDIERLQSFYPRVLQTPRHITDAEILDGVRFSDRSKFEKYIAIRNNYSHPLTETNPDNPNNPNNYGGVIIKTFLTQDLPTTNFNNQSIVTIIEFAGIKVVIPGDNEYASLDALMKEEAFKNAVRNAYVLIAPHHGRESAYNNDFINLVNPSLTVVSDGSICDTSANNRYSQKSTGWPVYNRKTGIATDRRCLTTNSDGEVYIDFGYKSDGGTFLSVQID